MMKLQTYAGLSLMSALAVIYHAFNSRGQFYPAMVYLSTSKISLVLLLNMGLVVMCIMWQLTKKIFLGSLREAEVERLNEQSWREVIEILFAITIFRQDFSVTFLAMITALLLIKALHWLAQKRVEYIETTPSVPMLSHIGIVSFMAFLLLIDNIFLYNSIKYLVETRQASVSLFFSFEYMILTVTTLSTFVKYIFHVSDMLMEGQWEKKAVYTFYMELIRDLLHLTLCMCFFLVIFLSPGYALLPQTFGHPANAAIAKDGGGVAASGLSQQYQFANTTFTQLPQCTFVPLQFSCVNGQFGAGSASFSQLDLQRKLIEHQTEFLQNMFQLLQTSNGEETMDLRSSDIKGKSVSSPSSSVLDSSEI